MEILDDDRPMRPAMLRGWRRRCPACGSGPMLQGYLKVRDHCPVCDEALHHHRADDGPAYLTIVVVGKLLTPLIFWVFTAFRPEPLVMAVAFSIAAVALSLYLLPRLKGMLVAIQWSRRMHGFGPSAD
ncbi:zinc-finger protein [Gemmobacter megaterium]|nr:zinc-finger protein [Gemmobacter megaterium]